MRVIARQGKEDIAVVYVAESEHGKKIEFVESLEPPIPREKKWVNIISTLYGCPVGCSFCDAGSSYKGKLTQNEILSQIDYLIKLRFGNGTVPVDRWKIQFARMGEPSFNMDVLKVLESLPDLYDAPGLMPSISTIAPAGTGKFFTRLLGIKRRYYPQSFQFQFSLHSTNQDIRRRLIPVRTWGFSEMADYGEMLHSSGGRKIALNFALMKDADIDPKVLREYFNPRVFIIKVTPLNPTFSAVNNGFQSLMKVDSDLSEIIQSIKEAGYEVIISIGELEENAIGSNCGQYVSAIENGNGEMGDAYSYSLKEM